MTNLINILKAETESLRIQYIDAVQKWAKEEFYELRAWAKRYHAGEFGFGVASKKYYRIPSYIVNSGDNIQRHIDAMTKEAEAHYEQSMEKLAYRIAKKGLNEERLVVHTAHVGVNIETVLTDGDKYVRAFTIIASGSVQKPHYRYLIK